MTADHLHHIVRVRNKIAARMCAMFFMAPPNDARKLAAARARFAQLKAGLIELDSEIAREMRHRPGVEVEISFAPNAMPGGLQNV